MEPIRTAKNVKRDPAGVGTPTDADSDTSDHEAGATSDYPYIDSSSEASDISDMSELELHDFSDLDEELAQDSPRLAQRFQKKTADLFEHRESILSEHKQVSFDQDNLISQLVSDKESRPPGICFGLSLEWLVASHARPEQSALERTEFISEGTRADRALHTQRTLIQVGAEMPFDRGRRYKGAVERSGHNGVQLGKYRKVKAESNRFTVSDVGIEAAHLIRHSGPYNLLSLESNLTAHAVACTAKPDGSFSLFDPDSGAYEVPSDKLASLLATIFATHVAKAGEALQNASASDENSARLLQDEGLPEFKLVAISPVDIDRG